MGLSNKQGMYERVFCASELDVVWARAYGLLYDLFIHWHAAGEPARTWACSSGVLYSSLGRVPGTQRYVFMTPWSVNIYGVGVDIVGVDMI